MFLFSLLAVVLLASNVIASPACRPSTLTVTETKIKIKSETRTVTTVMASTCPPIVATPTSWTSKSVASSPTTSTPITSSYSTKAPAPTSSSPNTNPTTTYLATATASARYYGLDDAAKAKGKLWFGTAADIPGKKKTPFDSHHDTCSRLVQFLYTEPEQNVFNFTGGDYFLELAETTGKLVRCHNLIWSSELPTWVTNPTVNWTNVTLSAVLENHVTTLIEHWGDRCYSWDVVNEALSDDPAGAYSSNLWNDIIGPEYVALAFSAAAQAVKKNNLAVKLYYNDYNIEYPGAKATAAMKIVTELKGSGIRVDGVGLESHFIVGETPTYASQVETKQNFTALSVNVVITELDVRLTLPASAATEQQQVTDYYDSAKSCADVEGCVGVTVWDFDDTYSWIPATFPGQGYGDLFLQPGGYDTPLVKKAAYDGALEALTGAADEV